jgi:GGDEF domain-containing protein
MRDQDLVAKDPEASSHAVHARFGGDELCFLIADLSNIQQVTTICRRFRDAVSGHDWGALDARLAERPVRVDIGVACLELGPLADRRYFAPRFAKQLIEWGDTAMYRAKADPEGHTHLVRLHVEDGELVATNTETADATSAS